MMKLGCTILLYGSYRILRHIFAGEEKREEENGIESSGGYNSCDGRPSTSPLYSLQPHTCSSSTATASYEPPTQSAVNPRASSEVSYKLPTSTKSILQKPASSEASASALKPTTSFKASADAASSLNPTRTSAAPPNVTNQLGKGTSVQVEKGKTYVSAVTKANEALKKENVTLISSTSKLPQQSAIRPPASSLESYEQSTSRKSILQELSPSKSPTSTPKPTTFSKASPVSALKLNVPLSPSPTSIPKANKDQTKKENVPLSPSTSKQNNQQGKARYTVADEGKTPVYSIPQDIEDMIKHDRVPDILLQPLSPSTYNDYFAALLYAEDYYIEKWNKFKLENVSLKLHKEELTKRSSDDNYSHGNHKKEYKTFVAFEIDSVPERRPFFLSRDFVFVRPSGERRDPFKGFFYRVKERTHVLVEFDEDFYYQHHSSRRYDVSFSFNRVCLKRAHHAIAAASDLLFQSFIFPDHISRKITPTRPASWCSYKLSAEQKSAVLQILSSRGPPPYLVEGPLCAKHKETRMIVKEAVVQILRSSSSRRVLICAPANKTCDELTSCLLEEIPEVDMFRANAAFRQIDEVPEEILDLSLHEGECFTCPALEELKMYTVIMSTFISTFRLLNVGLSAGHFSHIFLVDASSTSEPETMVALSNFATESTTVVVTGEAGDRSRWIRADIARKYGLSVSYFERLCHSKTYIYLDPMFITKLFC